MKKRGNLIALALVFFAINVVAQVGYLQPFWKKNYAPKQQGIAEGLSPDQLLAALAGFREMIAGILWVRGDSFFDSGNYDAILPIIRLVTWLDPHQIDVYATGMWHIGYNFTDQDQRSDRRYLPSALGLGMDGAQKNPDTYEMFFETGWMWFHKIDDLNEKAVYWLEQAIKRKDMNDIPARKNLLCSAYLRNGQVNEAISFWEELLAKATVEMSKKDAGFGATQNHDTVENNLDTLLVRAVQRGWVAKHNNLGASSVPYDTDPPFDVGFSARVTITDPKVLQVEGTWNVLPVGTRVRIILRDADYPNAIKGTVEWDKEADKVTLDPPRERTYMQDQLYVRNRKFQRKIDLSSDPTMYPFTTDKYILEFFYYSRSAPPHIQDKFSWNGEGMTDKNYAADDLRKDCRVIYTSFELSKDEILRRGDFRDKTPVRMTKDYEEYSKRGSAGEVIQMPGILSEPGNTPKPNPVPTKRREEVAQ